MEDSVQKKTLCFTLQAPTQRLKRLFRKKDGVEGILKESGIVENSTSLTFYNVFRFFSTHERVLNVRDFKPEHEEDRKTNKLPVEEEEILRLPVIKIYLSLTVEQINEVKRGIEKIKVHMIRPTNTSDVTFRVLEIALDMALDNRVKFNAYLKSGFTPSKNIAKQCLVCSDDAETLFCDTAVCLKCKHFFHGIMRRKTILTLRCSKNGNCFNKKYYDISCRKCRYDRCRVANMVEQYCFTELPELIVRSCLICRKSEDANKVVLGYSLCADCRHSFDELLNQKFEPICVNEPECRCATFECRKCLKDKLEEYGFFRSFKTKTYGLEDPPKSCFTPDNCCICLADVSSYEDDEKEIMGIVACYKCRSFLRASLDHENHFVYCCPRGEIGRLCPLKAEDGMKKCSYCWLYRCELEGLVERWQICSGDAIKWFDIIKSVEYVSDDENDGND